MAENAGFPAGELAVPLEVIEIGIKADPAQRDHDFHILETLQFAIEIRSAVRQLLGQRLVVGRSTTDGGGDVNISQIESVLAIGGVGLVGKASLVQYREHEFA